MMYKPQTIYFWKKHGIKSDDYDKLYYHHMSINNCQLCNVVFDNTSKNQRCLDHDHETGLYRMTLCRSCNASYLLKPRKAKKHSTNHMWISNKKSYNKKYNKYYFSWSYHRYMNNKHISRSFKTLTKALAFSFIQLLKKPI